MEEQDFIKESEQLFYLLQAKDKLMHDYDEARFSKTNKYEDFK